MDDRQTLQISRLRQLQFMVAAATLSSLFRKANFNPSQPRIPLGELGGGRWTDGVGSGSLPPQSPPASSTVPPLISNGGPYDVAATCGEHIAVWCKGSVMREFPSQYLNMEIEDVRREAQSGNAAARKALKLMFDKRFQK